MTIWFRTPALFLLFLWMCGLTACSDPEQKTDANVIAIGVAWPRGENFFIEGAELAVRQINDAGGIQGKTLELVVNENEQKVSELLRTSSALTIGESTKEISRQIARDFAKRKNKPVAVIGHRYSFLAIAAANIYQQENILYIAPTATNNILTTLNFDLIFRMLQNNDELGQQLALYAKSRNYKNVAVLGERSEYAQEITASLATTAAEKYDINVVYTQSVFYSATDRDFAKIAVELNRLSKEVKIDAIFMLGSAGIAARVYEQIRGRGGIDVPFLGAEALDSNAFWDKMKAWQETNNLSAEVAAPTLFHTDSQAAQRFIEQFKHFNQQQIPDRYAALGYDSILVVAQALIATKSTDSGKLADELRYMPPCLGLTGPIEFKDNGDVNNVDAYIKWLTKDGFSYRSLQDTEIREEKSTVHKCANLDQDDDGVPDVRDICAGNAPEELSKGVYYDGERIGCPVDADSDGVPDYRDSHPQNTAEEISKGVDAQGAPTDTDQDKVPDYREDCPADQPLALSKGVNPRGCPTDSDDDGVPDYQEQCLQSTEAERRAGVDTLGCPVDHDSDGIPDYLDKCPTNGGNELVGGIDSEGCPLDADQDGIADYRDQCPGSGQAELSRGMDAQGCPQDSDQDKVPDYLDACPTDSPEAISKGVMQSGCPVDSDTDGVADYLDQCPNNSAKEIARGVNAQGCPADSDGDAVPDYLDSCATDTSAAISKGVSKTGCPLDSDNDRVPDYLDACAKDSAEAISKGVKETGCPADSDNDGVPDYLDACAKDSAEAISKGVKESGCPADSDNDKVPDYLDACAKDSGEAISKGVKESGCPADTDNDSVPDYVDACAKDTAKAISKGVNKAGCPTDSDQDGVPDYLDACANDSAKAISQGVNKAGCPADKDGDAVPDYVDACPTDTAKAISKGVDKTGCPLDSDQDKVADYLDRCPQNQTKELAFGIDAQGCPADSDGDGLPDYLDKCQKTLPGLSVNAQGCPEEKTTSFPTDHSFTVGGDALSEPIKSKLKRFFQGLEMPLIQRIEVVAHTDSIGSEEFNQKLSKQRAQAVVEYLIELGVDRRTINARGAGKTQPIADNATEAGRSKNRRFEIRIQQFSRVR